MLRTEKVSKERNNKENWSLKETETADLGDARLTRRFGNLLEMLLRKPMDSIPGVSKSWGETKAAYRFFDNNAVTMEKILQPHKDATIERMRKEAVVLLPQDTTQLDYTSKPQTTGLGKLHYENQQGMHLHPTIAVTPERVCLGVVDAQIVIRKEIKKKFHPPAWTLIIFLACGENWSLLSLGMAYLENLAKKWKVQREEALPIEDKESMRWLKGYRVAQELAEQLPETTMVSISDREGDIYEIFVEASEEKNGGNAEYLIRCNQNRCLPTKDDKNKHEKLWNKIEESPVFGIVEFDLPRAPGRKARRVTQEIRAMSLSLNPPFRKDEKLPIVKINVVLATEINTSKGVKPLKWLLLTSLPIETQEQVMRVIEWYLCRWQVEVFFKILKSGCEVEELQLQTLDRLKPCLALYMIITWRILYMTMLGRQNADMPCNMVFEDEEWHAVYIVINKRPPPKVPPSLNQMLRMVASLGGFLNRKGDGAPGPQTIWVGLQRTRDFIIGMEALDASRS
jgi:hypothetical protein